MNSPKTGIYTASLTPFTASYEPEIPALISHVQWLLENGADGVALLGSTGEANSMTLEPVSYTHLTLPTIYSV